MYNQLTSHNKSLQSCQLFLLNISLILLQNTFNFFSCIYKYESQLHFSLCTTTTIDTSYMYKLQLHVLPIHNKEITKMSILTKLVLFIMLIQASGMEIEPCANSMWTQSTINNCYTGQMEQVEGCTKLTLQMALQKPYIFVSYCQYLPSESKQLALWCNLTECLLPSLAILDGNVNLLAERFSHVEQLLEQFLKQKQMLSTNVAFRQGKTNL